MIPSPIILYPMTNWSASGDKVLYTDVLKQSVSGEIPLVPENTAEGTVLTVQYRYKLDKASGVSGSWSEFIDYGVSIGAQDVGLDSVLWSVSFDGLIEPKENDSLFLEVKAVLREITGDSFGAVLDESETSDLTIHFTEESSAQASVYPVTGVKLKRYSDRVKILVPRQGITFNDESDFIGCCFYISLDAGGGENGYSLMNSIPVTDVDETETEEQLLEDYEYKDTTRDVIISVKKMKQVVTEYFTFTINKSVIAKLIVEGKISNVFLTDGQTLSPDTVFYLAVTVRVFNKVFSQAIESGYSMELESSFLKFNGKYQTLPERSRSDVLLSMSRDLMNSNSEVTVVPGSVIRDVADPVALEFEKAYTVQDFIFSCLSLKALLDLDDADGDGISDPVGSSPRKRVLAAALGIGDTTSLQMFIDEQFDKWASNNGVERKAASRARGSVVFYTEQRPTKDIVVQNGQTVSVPANMDLGMNQIDFTVLNTKIISPENAAYFYNSMKRRYEIEVDVEAVRTGSNGNVPAGSITIANSSIPSVRVENVSPMRYGSERETNRQLADRVEVARVAYDSGSVPGYLTSASGVPGVRQVKVAQAGSSFMMRDFDTESSGHLGGMIDIYVKGRKSAQVSDQVSFKYEYPVDSTGSRTSEVFTVADALDYRFKCTNPKVGSENPIVSVTRVVNVTKGVEYDLTNLTVAGDSDMIILEKSTQNQSIGLASLDIVEVDYTYRSSNTVILGKQPVERIVSVQASDGTEVDPGKYELVKRNNILDEGESSISGDSVRFLFSDADSVPEFVNISDETHDMIQGTYARLVMKGVDESSIQVFKAVVNGEEYKRGVDYQVIPGSSSEYTYIALTPGSKIRHGDRVRIDYRASENFTVTYTYNDLVNQVQERIDKTKHACSNTLVKQAVRNFVDFAFRVVKEKGVDEGSLRARIRTVLSNYIAGLKMGKPLTQGAVSAKIREVDGIAEVFFPFKKMMRRSNSFIPMEKVGSVSFEIYQNTSSSGLISYRSVRSALKHRTSENGGDTNLFRGVYENDRLLELVSDPSEVVLDYGRAYIQEDGKIIVSTSDGRPPQTKKYKVSYYTFHTSDDNEVSDIETSSIEYLDVDEASFKDIEVVEDASITRGF